MRSFVRCHRLVCAAAVLGLAAIAAALMVWRSPTAAARPMLTDPPFCVLGWSKNACDGKLAGDSIKDYYCTRNIDGTIFQCKSIEVNDATLKFNVKQNQLGCDPSVDVLCDEVKQLDGTIYITGDFIFRYQDKCRYRGCWSGEWKLVVDGVTVGAGTGHGPLGTGSHRAPNCLTPNIVFCNPDCEDCYDVQFFPSADPPVQGMWYVALEGCLEGSIFAGPVKSSEVCLAISGKLRTPGSNAEPYSFTSWEFCGATDGVVLVKCEL